MAPKPVSFKSVLDKVLTKKESPQNIISSTHSPSPLVQHSPTTLQATPSRTISKKLSIDRPLRISSDYSNSDQESQPKEFTTSNPEDLHSSQFSDKMVPSSNEPNQLSKISILSFKDKMKIKRENQMYDNVNKNPLMTSRTVDSCHTTTLEGSYEDDTNNDFELNLDNENTSRSTPDPPNEANLSSLVSLSHIESPDFKRILNDINTNSADAFSKYIKPFTSPEVQTDNPLHMLGLSYNCNDSNIIDSAMKEFKTKETQLNNFNIDTVTKDENMIKILVFTDTHLGYKEEDPVRGNDSLNTFEELMYISKHLEVDLILHSGDLFDKNIPSRSTMYRTMELISKYWTDNEVKIEVDTTRLCESVLVKNGTMDQKSPLAQFTQLFSRDVSRKNKGKLPFFVIHGNHDNPTYPNCLSPIDILDVAGLVTYFGRSYDLSNLEIKPILISKNEVKIALYGLGWIKDEKLIEMFKQNKVKFEKCPDFEKYYKIFLVHQNRYPRKGSGIKDYLTNDLIPEWMDLVLWGHEHENIKLPQKNIFENFHLIQMGSTIQTSLVPAEIPPKHSYLIHVYPDEVNFFPISLMSSRRLIYQEIDKFELKEEVTNQENQFQEYLKNVIEKMMGVDCSHIKTELNSLSLSEYVEQQEVKRINEIVENASIPLVRIKVDGGLCDSVNPKVFGQSFIGKVANPNDMLKISVKKHEKGESSQSQTVHSSITIKDQVLTSIEENCHLNLLLETELNEAVNRFALGMETQIIMEYVRKRVSMVQDLVKVEMKNFSDQLSEDLYSNLIEKFIRDKTSSERNKHEVKMDDVSVNEPVVEKFEVEKRPPEEGRKKQNMEFQGFTNKYKRRKNQKLPKCVNQQTILDCK